MRYWKVIFATLVIFGAGVITGMLLVNNSDHSQPPAPAPSHVATNPPPPVTNVVDVIRPAINPPLDGGSAANRLKKDFLVRYGQQLQLTPEQNQKIETILSESQNRTRELSSKIAPELREEVKHTRELIKAELNPDQVKKFDELMKPPKGKKKTEENRPKGTNHSPVKMTGTNVFAGNAAETNLAVTVMATNSPLGAVAFTNAPAKP